MKIIILLFCVISFSAFTAQAQLFYRHKSEDKLARMTHAKLVDMYADEYAYHRYDTSDEHFLLIKKYIYQDWLKAMPRIIEIIDEYDPKSSSGRSGKKGERFDAMWMLLGEMDAHLSRLRSFEERRRAIDALERAVGRMKAAGYGQPDQNEWERDGRFNLAAAELKEAKGINPRDEAIKETFRLGYKIILSDAELLEFSNFLAAQYPDYPGWSTTNFIKDRTQLNEAGNSLQIYTLKNPERYYETYKEFKKKKP